MSQKSKTFPAGKLLLIGGNEDPDEDNLCILPHVVAQSGGEKAHLLVCAGAASERPHGVVNDSATPYPEA